MSTMSTTKSEVRKLSWGGSLRYKTTTCTIPSTFLELWRRQGMLPTHVQLTQDSMGVVSITPVSWPADVETAPLSLRPQSFVPDPPEGLEDAYYDED